jgi:hypothetical protein
VRCGLGERLTSVRLSLRERERECAGLRGGEALSDSGFWRRLGERMTALYVSMLLVVVGTWLSEGLREKRLKRESFLGDG